MTLTDIKTALDAGKTVETPNGSYKIIKKNLNYYVVSRFSGNIVGLYYEDEDGNLQFNANLSDFTVK